MASDPWNVAQSVATIAAAVFAAAMIYLATKQLRIAADAYKSAAEQTTIAAKAASATALGALAEASRELQWRVLQDKALHAILVPASPQEGFSDQVKCDVVRGMLISHYAFVYEFKRLGQIPDLTWPALRVDMMDFFSLEPNKTRWKQVREFYGKEFQKFVDVELLRHPA
jgi:hypothetical protein